MPVEKNSIENGGKRNVLLVIIFQGQNVMLNVKFFAVNEHLADYFLPRLQVEYENK